ncbi:hypothetical protein CYMTET_8081 [Cymbomonas tetramitiformis]|uniref:Uncharacterized protein n=1 Tax=Cymbomonas tetramitiformis TaxID=36881 RepID=A0AAE0GU66_9CHLO|nr:hypothetical protein CYMTET_8081 [Cymbomonas tetramitiformis]
MHWQPPGHPDLAGKRGKATPGHWILGQGKRIRLHCAAAFGAEGRLKPAANPTLAVSGARFNERIDRLSQDPDLDNWKLNGHWFEWAEERSIRHTVDRFASEVLARLLQAAHQQGAGGTVVAMYCAPARRCRHGGGHVLPVQSLFQELVVIADEVRAEALQESARSNCGPKAKKFKQFCECQGRCWLPAAEETLCLYMAFLQDGDQVQAASAASLRHRQSPSGHGLRGAGKALWCVRALKVMAVLQTAAAAADGETKTDRLPAQPVRTGAHGRADAAAG